MIYAFDDMGLNWQHRHESNHNYDSTQREFGGNGKPQPRQYGHNGLERISLTQQPIEVDNALWTTEPSYAISLPEISPIGSDLASLPLTDIPLNAMDISEFQPPDPQVDSAWKEYTHLWRQVIEDPTLFDFGTLSSSTHVEGLGLEAEPTPPLDLEISPIVHFASYPSTSQHQQSSTASSSIELVAPKPRRLVNPAIHLAALVEEDDTNSVTASGPATAVNEGAQEVVPLQEEVRQMQEVVPLVAMYGHSMDQLREYMSDSDLSSGELEERQPARFDMASSLPASSDPSSDSISFDDWSFPPAHLTSFEPLPLEPPSSPFHINPQLFPRTSQLREAMRERRIARHVLQTHCRHTSLPDVQYRPPKWSSPMISESVHHRAALPVRRRESHTSYSVDWSAVPSQEMILVPPPDDFSYHLNAPQYAAMPSYGNQPTQIPYGGQ